MTSDITVDGYWVIETTDLILLDIQLMKDEEKEEEEKCIVIEIEMDFAHDLNSGLLLCHGKLVGRHRNHKPSTFV